MSDDLAFVLERSKRTAEREERRRTRHPSTQPREVRCFEGVNQRALGHPSACTHYAAAFVARASTVRSDDITAEWLLTLMLEPGLELPAGAGRHPDPVDVVAVLPGLRARGGDSICVTGGALALAALLRKELLLPQPAGTAAGALILNSTETLGVARCLDGIVALFDSHGDSTQTEPAFALLWTAGGAEAAALGIADFVEERSWQQQFELGDLLDVVIIDRR